MLKIRQNEGGTCSKAVDPYFCNYVIAYLKQMPELGPNPDARMQTINTAGLTIKTTLRRDWQKKLAKELTDRVPSGTDRFGAAAAIVQPGTGKVRAIAQTSEYKVGMEQATTEFSEQAWTVPAQYGGTNGFAIGSTAKMYALVAALEKGMPMESTIDAPAGSSATFTRDEFQKKCTTTDAWSVANAEDAAGGTMTLAEATKRSVNTAFAQLASDIGSCSIPKVMAKMGLTDGYGLPYGLAQGGGEKIKGQYAISNIVLGSDSTSPLQLASSYATLAADGEYCPPTPIESITRADGTKMKIDPPKCKQVIDKGIARGATELLTNTMEDGGTAAAMTLANGRQAAAKTGTTDDNKQSWFAGFTPQLATAVWVGSPITEHKMTNVSIGGQFYEKVYGGTMAGPIWTDIMNAASKGMDQKEFTEPSKQIVKGDLRDIPNVVGEGPTQARAALEKAGFKVSEGGTVSSGQQAGSVAYTDPPDEALKGSTVTMYISSGVPPYTPPTTPTAPTAPTAPTTQSTPTAQAAPPAATGSPG